MALFGKGEVQEYSRDLLFASAAVVALVALGPGGPAAVTGAITAVASVAGGAAVAAGLSSLITGSSFNKNFHSFFRISLAFLVASAGYAAGAKGTSVAGYSGNGLQGQVIAKGDFVAGYESGMTIGSAAVVDSTSIALSAHEFGHTIQFIGIAALNSDPSTAWRTYLGVGALGLIGPHGYNPIEIIADSFGGVP